MEKLISVNINIDENFKVYAGFRLHSDIQKNIQVFFSNVNNNLISELGEESTCERKSNLRSNYFLFILI